MKAEYTQSNKPINSKGDEVGWKSKDLRIESFFILEYSDGIRRKFKGVLEEIDYSDEAF